VIVLTCPNCGERNVNEFRYGGEARPRPSEASADSSEWTEYLYMRANPLGIVREWWYHRAGCGCWFIAERHTQTHDVVRTYRWEDRA
jgi:heterotetrameric sarcosine oxidase delta subunit